MNPTLAALKQQFQAGTLSKPDFIRTALEVFLVNRFHAIPVVDNDELVGIVTTFDIIKAIESEPIPLENYKKAQMH